MTEMRTRKILYLAIAAAILSLAVALPALAEEPIPMWIQRNRMAWTGRSSGGPDMVVAKIHIFDANRAMVTDAKVTATWTHTGPLGTTIIAGVDSFTAFQGIAEFRLWKGRGEYEICVTDVDKGGWLYDPTLNFGSECSSIDV
jgi:hypothetical protein